MRINLLIKSASASDTQNNNDEEAVESHLCELRKRKIMRTKL